MLELTGFDHAKWCKPVNSCPRGHERCCEWICLPPWRHQRPLLLRLVSHKNNFMFDRRQRDDSKANGTMYCRFMVPKDLEFRHSVSCTTAPSGSTHGFPAIQIHLHTSDTIDGPWTTISPISAGLTGRGWADYGVVPNWQWVFGSNFSPCLALLGPRVGLQRLEKLVERPNVRNFIQSHNTRVIELFSNPKTRGIAFPRNL